MLELIDPYVDRRILLGKERVTLFEDIQEFRVAETDDGELIGCGALHVIWEDLGEIRTIAVAEPWLRRGVGRALLEHLEQDARALGLSGLFGRTFELECFTGPGFEPSGEQAVAPAVSAELVRSPDDGVAEFLDLARGKQNTLGNTRMLKHL